MHRITPLLVLLSILGLVSACEVEPPSGSLNFTVEGAAELPEALQAVSIDWTEEVTWTRQVVCSVDSRLDDTTYRVAAYDRSVADGIDVALAVQAYDGPGVYARDEFQPSTALWISFLDEGVLAEERPDEGRDERDDDDSAADDDDSAAGADDDDSSSQDDDDVVDDDDSAPVDDDDSAPGADDDDSSSQDDDDSSSQDDDDITDDDDVVDDDDIADDDDITDDDDVAVEGQAWELDSSRGGSCTLTVNDDGRSGSFVCQELPAFVDGVELEVALSVNGQWSCSELATEAGGGGGFRPFFR